MAATSDATDAATRGAADRILVAISGPTTPPSAVHSAAAAPPRRCRPRPAQGRAPDPTVGTPPGRGRGGQAVTDGAQPIMKEPDVVHDAAAVVLQRVDLLTAPALLGSGLASQLAHLRPGPLEHLLPFGRPTGLRRLHLLGHGIIGARQCLLCLPEEVLGRPGQLVGMRRGVPDDPGRGLLRGGHSGPCRVLGLAVELLGRVERGLHDAAHPVAEGPHRLRRGRQRPGVGRGEAAAEFLGFRDSSPCGGLVLLRPEVGLFDPLAQMVDVIVDLHAVVAPDDRGEARCGRFPRWLPCLTSLLCPAFVRALDAVAGGMRRMTISSRPFPKVAAGTECSTACATCGRAARPEPARAARTDGVTTTYWKACHPPPVCA